VGTKGYDSVAAIHELYPHILTMHLKDVLAAGAHDTCRFGKGVVPIEACVRLLAQKATPVHWRLSMSPMLTTPPRLYRHA
jgi:sugar phosphate isomerase/epimerase